MTPEHLCDHIVEALESRKGRDIVTMEVRGLTDITDFMIIASGTSNRHVRALVDQVIGAAKEHRHPPLGVEGVDSCEWVLLDFGDVLVHVMQAATREFYDLERLWCPLTADSAG